MLTSILTFGLLALFSLNSATEGLASNPRKTGSGRFAAKSEAAALWSSLANAMPCAFALYIQHGGKRTYL